MADEHFSHEIIERFLRSELSRGETRELVRHLLRRCRRCSWLLQQAGRGQSLRAHGCEGVALRLDPAHPTILGRIVRMAERKEWPAKAETGAKRGLEVASSPQEDAHGPAFRWRNLQDSRR